MGIFQDFVEGFAYGQGYSPEDSIAERKLSATERADLISGISQMRLALARAYRQQNDSAIQLLSEQMDVYNANRKLSGDILRTILNNEGKVDVANVQAQAANLRNIRDNKTRAISNVYAAGQRLFLDVVGRYIDPTKQLSPGDRAQTIWRVLAEMPPTPALAIAMQQAAAEYGDPTGAAAQKQSNAEGALANIQAEIDALTKVVEDADAGRIPSPADAVAILEILKAPQSLPTYEEAKLTVGAPEGISGIEGQISEFEQQLADTRQGRYAGPSNEELQALAGNPSYRKWAEARGFTLGDVRDSGVYVPGRGDLAAFLAAQFEKQGKTFFTGAHKLGDTESIEVVPQGFVSTPVVPPEDVQVDEDTVVFTDEEGNIKILTPSMDFVRDFDPEKDSADIKAAVAQLKPEQPEVVTRTLEGRAIPPAYGDNINTTKRLAVREGNTTFEVVLKKNPEGMWVEAERIERPRYNFLTLPVAPGVSSQKERRREERAVVQAEKAAALAADQEQAVIAQEEKKAEREAVAAEKEKARAEREVLSGPAIPPAPVSTPADERGKPAGALPPQKRDVPPILAPDEPNPPEQVVDVSAEFAAPAPVDRSPEDQALDRKMSRMASGPGGPSGYTEADALRQQQLAIQQADRALALSQSPATPEPVKAPESARQRLLRKYGKSVGATVSTTEPPQ